VQNIIKTTQNVHTVHNLQEHSICLSICITAVD